MRLVFRGQRRQVYVHRHPIKPGRYGGSEDDTLKWVSSTEAVGRIQNVTLTGDFVVTFQFDKSELRNWLQVYVEENPTEGLRLLSELHTEAIIRVAGAEYEDPDD